MCHYGAYFIARFTSINTNGYEEIIVESSINIDDIGDGVKEGTKTLIIFDEKAIVAYIS